VVWDLLHAAALVPGMVIDLAWVWAYDAFARLDPETLNRIKKAIHEAEITHSTLTVRIRVGLSRLCDGAGMAKSCSMWVPTGS
jgi:hypothetical protein